MLLTSAERNRDLLFYLAQTRHPVRRSGSPMILITRPNLSPTHTCIPILDKYTVGNYSREACLSGAVRTVIAGGMVGYRETNRCDYLTLVIKRRGETWRLSPRPFSYLQTLNKVSI